jgi:crotonobetainyl-CoA:carnitine CoA-transferase CaiB-like acyl-CoA transferase
VVGVGAPISDFSSGLFGLAGVLAALFARERFPKDSNNPGGRADASLNMMCTIPSVTTLGAKVERVGSGHAQIVPYQAFLCADREYVMVGAFTRQFWWNLCRAVGHEEWIKDPRFATNALRLANRAVLVGELDRIFASRPRAEWLDILEAADVPTSPVLELHDAVKTEQVRHNGALRTCRRRAGRRVPGARRAMGRGADAPAPRPGADTNEVLSALLGLEALVAGLAGGNVIGVAE